MIIRTRLTQARMWAIQNALAARLDRPIVTSSPCREDYERALVWINEEIAARSKRSVDRGATFVR